MGFPLIRVNKSAQPVDFNVKVKNPGRAFLVKTPRPTSKQWASHSYWTRVTGDLYKACGGICAYSGCYIPYVTGTQTIDHQRPKDRYPALAYDWDNFILAALLPNSFKRTEIVLDPRKIGNDWFFLDIPSLTIKPNSSKSPRIVKYVGDTIKHLKLDDQRYIAMRKNNLSPFIHEHWDFAYLAKVAPFIARELQRQGLSDPKKLKAILPLPPPPIFLP